MLVNVLCANVSDGWFIKIYQMTKLNFMLKTFRNIRKDDRNSRKSMLTYIDTYTSNGFR